MRAEDIRKVLVLGAGTMGHQIGFLCAANGCEVAIYDVSAACLGVAKERIAQLADRWFKQGNLAAGDKAAVLARITLTDQPAEAAREADLLSESVPEDPQLKQKVFRTFDALCPERTIFTTNSSMLIPSMIAEATGRPDRFLAFHFHDILVTRVVDVMPHPGTSDEATDCVQAFAERIGQTVIRLRRENFGYVFNAMLSGFLTSALNLAAKQIASIEDIDRAWIGVMHTPRGPFGIMDSVGLDTVWRITDYQAKQTGKQPFVDNAAFLKTYVDRGALGEKSGEGFYRYLAPEQK